MIFYIFQMQNRNPGHRRINQFFAGILSQKDVKLNKL